MKNKKLISTLLTATLTLSSLPMTMAAPVSAVTQIVDALETSVPGDSDITAVTPRSEGNKYLHFYNRGAWNHNLHFQIPVALEETTTYAVYADVRVPVNYAKASKSAFLKMTINTGCGGAAQNSTIDSKPYDLGIGLTADGKEQWKTVKFTFTTSAKSQMVVNGASKVGNLTSSFFNFRGWYSDGETFPYDIDNVVVVKIANGNETPIFDKITFDDKSTSDIVLQGTTNSGRGGKFWDREALGGNDNYRTQAVAEVVKDLPYYSVPAAAGDDNTSFSYNNITVMPGVYALSGEIRLNDYITGGDNSTEVTVSYSTAEATAEFTDAIAVTSEWTAIPGGYVIEIAEKTTISELLFTADTAKSIDFRNISLIAKVSSEENVLDTVMPEATGTVNDILADENKYLHVSERNPNVSADSTTGAGYGVGLKGNDVIPYGAQTVLKFKARANFGESGTLKVCTPNISSSATSHNYTTNIAITDEWAEYTVSGTTQREAGFNAQFGIDANGNWSVPFDIDDVEFYYTYTPAGESAPVTRYIIEDEDFESFDVGTTPANWYLSSSNGKAPATPAKTAKVTVQREAVSSLIEAVDGTETALTYALDRELSAGTYKIAGYFRVPCFDKSDVNADNTTLKVIFAGASASAEPIVSKRIDVGNEWVFFSHAFKLAKTTTISDLAFILGADLPLEFMEVSFSCLGTDSEGSIPNIGIVMVMLAKKQGSTGKVKPVKTQFIENGDFDTAPVIFNSVPSKVQTAESAGWYAKNPATAETTIEYAVEDGNGFIRVKDLNTSQRGVYWNTGVMLEPGTYTFKMDVRVSETADSAAYNGKKWRDNGKETMQIRANLGDPNGMFAPHFAAFDPVDLNSPMNQQGQVYGNCVLINRKWTTYTDVITIDKPILAVFKIGGGTGGEVDAHGFDIDNISLIGYKTPEGVESEAPAPTNLVTNGDFTEAPEIIATFDETRTAWVENDGEDAKRDSAGKALEEKMLYDHKVEYKDGEILISGRQYNLRPVFYNTGVTLEAGTYRMSIDVKTAKTGETSYVRVGVSPASNTNAVFFTPTPFAVSNDYTTNSAEFTIKESYTAVIKIYGGMSTSYIHDLVVDNIVIEKIG